MIPVTRITYRFNTGKNSKHLATCTVVLGDVLMLHGIKIRDSNYGPYITFPKWPYIKSQSTESGAGSTRFSESKTSTGDIYHPVSKHFQEMLRKVLIDGYFECRSKNIDSFSPPKGVVGE